MKNQSARLEKRADWKENDVLNEIYDRGDLAGGVFEGFGQITAIGLRKHNSPSRKPTDFGELRKSDNFQIKYYFKPGYMEWSDE